MKIEGPLRSKLLQRETWVFPFFLLLVLLVYFPVRYAGFVTDFIGFETNYDNCGFWHYYDCAGIKNFRYLQHAFSYVLYKTVGSGSIIWYVLYSLFYALSAYAGYRTLKLLLTRLDIRKDSAIAFFSAFIFLLSPYNTEVVVWKVCIQYITVFICLLLSINQLLYYFEDQKMKRIIFAGLLFLVGLFSLEQAVIIPPCLFLLGFLFYLREKEKKFLIGGLKFSVPLFLLTGAFFSLSRIVYGKWIMHYGSEAFNSLFSLSTYSNFYKYFTKHLLLSRYWGNDYKYEFIDYLGTPVVLFILSLTVAASILFLFYKTRKRSGYAFFFLFAILFFAISCTPIISLFFTHTNFVTNDRVGFIPSFFVYALFTAIVFRYFDRFKIFLVSAYIIMQAWFLLNTVKLWNEAHQYMTAFNKNFHYYDHSQVVILGVPHSYKGVWMYLILGENSGFEEVLKYRGKHEYKGQMLEAAQFNQINQFDALTAEMQNDSSLYVSFKHGGSWFDRNGVGLLGNDYENEHYAVKTGEYGYWITFKKLEKDHLIIYPDSLRWKSLVMPKFK